jgi:pimeloyl-ACP methyl ester carboxylesterase
MPHPTTAISPNNVDVVEAGSAGPVVVLVHSSVSGARQWRRLMDDLKDRFRVHEGCRSAERTARHRVDGGSQGRHRESY